MSFGTPSFGHKCHRCNKESSETFRIQRVSSAPPFVTDGTDMARKFKIFSELKWTNTTFELVTIATAVARNFQYINFYIFSFYDLSQMSQM